MTIMTLESKVNVNYMLKTCLTACKTISSFNIDGFSYLAQCVFNGVHIKHKDCLLCVGFNEGFRSPI